MNTIITQAMATGLPVIATNHSGLPEQVLDGHNGLIVPEGDYHSLANAILWLMNHSEVWPELGRAGRSRAAARYDSKKLVERQIQCYMEVSRVPGGAPRPENHRLPPADEK